MPRLALACLRELRLELDGNLKPIFCATRTSLTIDVSREPQRCPLGGSPSGSSSLGRTIRSLTCSRLSWQFTAVSDSKYRRCSGDLIKGL